MTKYRIRSLDGGDLHGPIILRRLEQRSIYPDISG